MYFIQRKLLVLRICSLILFITLSAFHTCLSQDTLRVLPSGTRDIKIKFNEDVVVSWHLEPEKNPDVFQIGSTLKTKQVKFITDIDSVTFKIKSGQKIDFIILLNGAQECHTRIDAMKDPIFLKKKIGIPALVMVILLTGLFFQKSKSISVNTLLRIGWWVPVLFWVITIIAGFLHGNYNHLIMPVSELGMIGTRSEIFISISLFILSILCFLFSCGFYKKSISLNLNRIPAILSFSMSISIAWAAIFPLGHELHGALGPLPLLLMIGVLVASVYWNEMNFSSIRIFSGVSLFIMMFFLLRFAPGIQHHYEGLVQRFFYLGWSVWFVSLSFYLRKID